MRKDEYQEEIAQILSESDIELLRDKTFVLTGATGMIGKELVDALLYANSRGANINIVAIGRSLVRAHERFGDPLPESLHFYEQDIATDYPPLPRVDYIIPLASNTHPLAYSAHPIETMTTNIVGAIRALDCAARTGALVLYPSSVEVYGNTTEGAFSEETTGSLNLSTARACYTESKRACEALCQSYAEERGVRVKIARLCRVFGPTMLPTDSKASSQFLRAAISGADIVIKSEGQQFFSYIYTADAVSAMLHIMLHGEQGKAYNIANNECNVRLRDFAEECARVAGRRVVVSLPNDTEQKGYSIATRAVLDNKRLLDLGWKPRYNFADAIRRTISIKI